MPSPLQEFLSQVDLTNDELNDIYPLLRSVHLKKGEFLYSPESTEYLVCLIQKGILRNYYKVGDKEFTYHFGIESTVNVASSIFNDTYKAIEYIQAVEDCDLVCINYDDLQSLFDKSINFANLGRLAAEKSYIRSHLRVTSFLLYSAEERYELLAKHIPEVFQRVPLYQIASYLGLEPQSLSRIRRNSSKKK